MFVNMRCRIHSLYICRTLSSNHQRFARRNSIRQNDVQVGMTIMRYQIRRLVSKNNAIIIVIEDDCHPTMFQCRSAQVRFAHDHHVKCDLDQDSFSTVCHHVPVHHFLSAVLQCHVVRCHSVDVCGTHHWKLRCIPRWADMSKNIQNRSSTRAPQSCSKTDLPNSPCTDVSCCLPAKISRVPHLRIQSCSLEINLAVVLTCSNHRLVYCCHYH